MSDNTIFTDEFETFIFTEDKYDSTRHNSANAVAALKHSDDVLAPHTNPCDIYKKFLDKRNEERKKRKNEKKKHKKSIGYDEMPRVLQEDAISFFEQQTFTHKELYKNLTTYLIQWFLNHSANQRSYLAKKEKIM